MCISSIDAIPVILSILFLAATMVAVVLHVKAKNVKKQFYTQISALEHELTILSTAFDATPDVMFCKDVDFKITKANKAFETLLGLDRENIVGKREYEFMDLPPEVVNVFKKWDNTVLETQSTHRVEEQVPDANGDVRTFETMKTPIMSKDTAIGIFGVARDISKRKELEREMINASKAKTAFIANMSHEIRTPMNSIMGFSELALEEDMSSTAREHLRRIIDNSKGLLQIINDILDVSKIESGKMELEYIPFCMQEIFTHCQSAILPKALEKGVNMHFNAGTIPTGTMLLGDPVRIRQVLLNLLSNAVKFTDVGSIKVEATITHSTPTSQTIKCEIKDSGIGMSQEQISRALEPFMQADATITRRYGGTGLGLPIVKNLVDMMGGTFHVESILGVGSTCSFELTFEITDAPSWRGATTGMIEDERPIFDADVLVCEDNTMNQMVIREHLQKIGIRATIAENGLIGYQMVQDILRSGSKPFDLILMDVHMPIMDGLEAAEKIKTLGANIPIVALTANVMTTDRDVYTQYGMVDCVGKPFVAHELWSSLLKYITPVKWVALGNTHTGDVDITQDTLAPKLRKRFVKENQNKIQEIMHYLNSNQVLDAHRLVHSLKSSAGLIGEVKLQEMADEIENLLKYGENNVPFAKWGLLELELNTILDGLTPLLAEPTPKKAPHQTSMEVAGQLVQQLEPLLQSRNLACLSLLDEMRDVEGFEAIADHMEAYDFKLALTCLSKIKEGLGVKP